MDRRTEKRVAKRRQLVQHAMDIVVAEGLDGLTIARLAEAAEMAVGALYRYFNSKNELLVALQQDAIETYTETLEAEVARADRWLTNAGDFSNSSVSLFRILVAVSAYLWDAEEEPARHRLIDSLVSAPTPILSDEDAATINNGLAPILTQCDALFDRAVEAGALQAGDAAPRTHVLWAGLHGLDHFRKRDRIQPEKVQVAALRTLLLSSVLRGFGAEPAPLNAAMDALTSYERAR